MKAIHYTVSWLIRIIIGALCKIDACDLGKLPKHGPCILVTNHINFLEVPLLYTRLMPRNVTALVKTENWNNPLYAFLGNLWDGIPITRGGLDRKAIGAAKDALAGGKILVVTPEGTRSGDGRLKKGHPGIVLFAANSGIPVFPLAHHGGELFWKNLSSLRRTNFKVKLGRPFLVSCEDKSPGREERRAIADEIMRKIAELLPGRLQGYYANHSGTGYTYLQTI